MAKVEGLKATRQPLSGVLPDYPSDVIIQDWLVEVKVRAEKILAKGDRVVPVDFEWLEKVDKNARRSGFRHGIVVVHRKYHNEPGVLMRWTTYMELMKRCYENDDT